LFVRVAIEVSKMSQFNPEIFMSKPDGEAFFALKKGELIRLPRHLQLEVKMMLTCYIQQMIVLRLVDMGVFGMTELEIIKGEMRRERRDRHVREEKE